MSKSKVFETSFRVYNFAESLIENWRKARDRQGTTNRVFVADATGKHLAPVMRELRAIGLTGRSTERCAVWLEVPLSVLADLAGAAEMTAP